MNHDNCLKLNIIVATNKYNGIGINNSIPWKVKEDMEYFKNTTIGNGKNCVIMGRKTYESIPPKYRPLNKRDNIVLSTKYIETSDFYSFTTIDKCFEFIRYSSYDNVWVIGGSMIYDEILKNYDHLIQEIHITSINDSSECDKFFYLPQHYKLVNSIELSDIARVNIFKKPSTCQNMDYH